MSVQVQILNLLNLLRALWRDRLVVMKARCVEEQGARAEVLARPSRQYTRQLLAAVPRLATV